MLFVPKQSVTTRFYDNANANPTSTPGQAINVSYGGSAEASFTTLVTSANCSQDVYAIFLNFITTPIVDEAVSLFIEIAVDPAGGTSWTTVVEHMVASPGVFITGNGGCKYLLPLFVKAGSSIGMRIYTNNSTTPNTIYCNVRLYGQNSRPEAFPVGTYAEVIGSTTDPVSSPAATSFTPGATGSWGSWASLGTTSKPLWWWQLCVGHSASALNNRYTYVEFAYGDATNKHLIMTECIDTSAAELMCPRHFNNLNFLACYAPLPAGTTLYVRGKCSGTVDATWTACALGIGG